VIELKFILSCKIDLLPRLDKDRLLGLLASNFEHRYSDLSSLDDSNLRVALLMISGAFIDDSKSFFDLIGSKGAKERLRC